MEIKEQVLSIAQVLELQELGFDVEKHASMCLAKLFDNDDVYRILNKEYAEYMGLNDYIFTLSIGDIIEVLPEKIKTYSANAGKDVSFCLRINNTEILYISLFTDDFIGCFSKKDKLINNLFNTLVWCIKQKYIKI